MSDEDGGSMAELPKPPSLEMESGELEPLPGGDSGEAIESLEPIDVNESGPVAPSTPLPVKLPPAPTVPASAAEPAPESAKTAYRPVPIPENPDAPRAVHPPTITGGESKFEVGRKAPDTHEKTDEVPSALLNPTAVVSGASAATTPPPPAAGSPAAGFVDTMLDVQNALPDQGLTAAGSDPLGGRTDEIVRDTHADITAKTEDVEVMADTIDEVLHQSTEQALRLANVVDDVERIGGSVAELRAEMETALGGVDATVRALQASAGPVTVSGQPAATEIDRFRDAFNARLDDLELETARKLKRQSSFQTAQLILLVAVLIALALLIVRGTQNVSPRASNAAATPAQPSPPDPLNQIIDDPPLEPIEGVPPATPKGRAVPIGEPPSEVKKPVKKKRRRRKK